MAAANDLKALCRRLFEERKRRVIELSDRCLAEKWSAEDAEKLGCLAQAYVDCVAIAVAEASESEMQPVWERTYAVSDRIPLERFPESAATCAIRALTVMDDNVEEATGWLAKAIAKDESCWFAAGMLGSIYQEAKNWKAACGYFEQAARHAVDCAKPDLYSSLALCNDKARDHVAEVDAYRACLALDADYPGARNNLGVALMQLGRCEEAETVLREAIRRGEDGTRPSKNLARVLRKLERFQEAIDVLKHIRSRGRQSKYVEQEIAELQGLIERGESDADSVEEDNDVDLDEADAIAEPADSSPAAEMPQGLFAPLGGQQGGDLRPGSLGRKTQKQLHREEILEEIIEKQIERHQRAFDCNLRMYDKRDEQGYRSYGRQFAMPDGRRIDLLAEEIDTGGLVVIELKRGSDDRKVVGQISEYMTWVRQHSGRSVRGIICVSEASDRLRAGAANVRDLDVYEYELVTRRVSSS